jgi:transposase
MLGGCEPDLKQRRPTVKDSTTMPAPPVQALVQTLGMDIGDMRSSHCLVSASGETLSESSVATTHGSLVDLFETLEPCRVVIEACGHVHWIAQLASEAGHEVIVANPRELRLISQSGRKNDRNDARVLARLGRVDVELLRPVKLRGEDCRASRSVLQARDLLVRTRTKLVNFVRGQVKTFGGRIPSCSTSAFTKKAIGHVPAAVEQAVTPVLDTLKQLEGQIRDLDQEVERQCEEQYPETGVFRQVKGVGSILGLAYVATIEDPARFASSSTVGNYVGLAPGQYASGAKTPELRISKRGDHLLRRLLVNAATYILGPFGEDSDLKRFGKRIAAGGSQRDKARARIAVARKLACLLHHLWRTGSVWDPNHSASIVTQTA